MKKWFAWEETNHNALTVSGEVRVLDFRKKGFDRNGRPFWSPAWVLVLQRGFERFGRILRLKPKADTQNVLKHVKERPSTRFSVFRVSDYGFNHRFLMAQESDFEETYG